MAQSMNVSISTRGSILTVGVGVFWDQDCNNPVSSLSWGVVKPGTTKNITVYIRNEGNSRITIILNTTDWDSLNASNYIDLSWDYMGEIIDVYGSIKVTLILSIAPNIEGIIDFDFNIVISASSYP